MDCGENLSTYKREILRKFRFNLQDLLTPDHTDAELLKWLRAKNFDLKKAENNFREVDSCRKMFAFDALADTYVQPKVLRKYARTCCLGFAKDGSAVRYYGVHADLYGFTQSLSVVDLCFFLCYTVESDMKALREENRKTGKNHSGITYILDMEEFSFHDLYSKSVIEAGLTFFSLFQDHYPEIWNHFFYVNAPYIFDKVLALFKPVLRGPFRDKIQIATKSSTSQLLRKYIDDDVLPAFLGGSRVDSKGDPRFRELINDYSKIPEEYYLKNIIHFIEETDSGVKVVNVGARSVYNVPMIIKNIGTKIRIEVRTENGSICYCILHQNFASDSENPELPECDEYLDPHGENSNIRVVGTKMRLQCHIAPSDVTCTAKWPGIYIFQFDNTASWLGSRKLYFRITASPPDM